jgi:RHS repeat-associated protein
MPGRSGSFNSYRYGFNGMESDDEISGEGNSYTTEYRHYDPRIMRWKSLDPLMSAFPHTSPYVAFANNPIVFTDPYGLAPVNGDGPGDDKKKGNGQLIEGTENEYDGWQDVEGYDVIANSSTGESNVSTGSAGDGETSYSLSYSLNGKDYNHYGLNYDEKTSLVADYWQNKWEQKRSDRRKSFWDSHMPTYDIDYPSILPDAISISIQGDASAGVATSGEFKFTWILFGEDASGVPYITYVTKAGGSSPGVGAGISLEGIYKHNGGNISANDLVTPKLKRPAKIEFHGREFGGSVGPIQAAYEYTPLMGGGSLHSYSFGVNVNAGASTIFDASIMSTIAVPLNFGK